MKFTIGLFALAFQAAGVFSRTAEEHAALVEECGDLGVLEVPEGADPSLYRHCANHPNGAERQWEGASLAPSEPNKPRNNVANMKGAELFARACYSGAPYGCDKGFCWKICGDQGQWCWTALGDGGGDWRSCTVWSQCSDSQDHKCGKNCKPGNKACGCSC